MSYDDPTDNDIQCEMEARAEEAHDECRGVPYGCGPDCPWAPTALTLLIARDPHRRECGDLSCDSCS